GRAEPPVILRRHPSLGEELLAEGGFVGEARRGGDIGNREARIDQQPGGRAAAPAAQPRGRLEVPVPNEQRRDGGGTRSFPAGERADVRERRRLRRDAGG